MIINEVVTGNFYSNIGLLHMRITKLTDGKSKDNSHIFLEV